MGIGIKDKVQNEYDDILEKSRYSNPCNDFDKIYESIHKNARPDYEYFGYIIYLIFVLNKYHKNNIFNKMIKFLNTVLPDKYKVCISLSKKYNWLVIITLLASSISIQEYPSISGYVPILPEFFGNSSSNVLLLQFDKSKSDSV